MLNILSHWENANQNDSEIPFYTCKNGQEVHALDQCIISLSQIHVKCQCFLSIPCIK